MELGDDVRVKQRGLHDHVVRALGEVAPQRAHGVTCGGGGGGGGSTRRWIRWLASLRVDARFLLVR